MIEQFKEYCYTNVRHIQLGWPNVAARSVGSGLTLHSNLTVSLYNSLYNDSKVALLIFRSLFLILDFYRAARQYWPHNKVLRFSEQLWLCAPCLSCIFYILLKRSVLIPPPPFLPTCMSLHSGVLTTPLQTQNKHSYDTDKMLLTALLPTLQHDKAMLEQHCPLAAV